MDATISYPIKYNPPTRINGPAILLSLLIILIVRVFRGLKGQYDSKIKEQEKDTLWIEARLERVQEQFCRRNVANKKEFICPFIDD